MMKIRFFHGYELNQDYFCVVKIVKKEDFADLKSTF